MENSEYKTVDYVFENEISFEMLVNELHNFMKEISLLSVIKCNGQSFLLKKVINKNVFDLYFNVDYYHKERFKIVLKDNNIYGFWSNKKYINANQYEQKTNKIYCDNLLREINNTKFITSILTKDNYKYVYYNNNISISIIINRCWFFDPENPQDGEMHVYIELESDSEMIDLLDVIDENDVLLKNKYRFIPLKYRRNNKYIIGKKYINKDFYLRFNNIEDMKQEFKNYTNIIDNIKDFNTQN